MIDSSQEARRAAGLVIKSLTDLGYSWQTQVGDVVTVRFTSVAIADLLNATWAICEVDTLRLPRKVTARDLTKTETLHHLATVVGHPVRCLNSTGVTYCIQLTQSPQPVRPRLPHKVPLDVDAATAGAEPGQLAVPVGASIAGPVWRPLVTLGHTLITGASGSGKSNWIHAGLASLLTRYTREQLQIVLIDPKTSEFAAWRQAPHLYGEVATDVEHAVGLLEMVICEMDHRGDLLAGALVRDLAAYNRRAAQPLPYMLVVIDEVIDLLLEAGGENSELAKGIKRLAVRGRSNGILLWIASQHGRFDVLPRTIGLNLASRLAFRVQDANAARLAGCPGAQDISRKIPGRFIANLDGEPMMLQAYHVDDEALLAIADGLGVSAYYPNGLSDKEVALVRFAVDELGGRFIRDRLAAEVPGWSRHHVGKLASQWEHRRWLTAPASPVEPRMVTQELREMAGV